ncbi:type II toxin-antitoxin system VapC family toxin [Sphingomonas sp. RT2P30]|uniref:type II toxin-antitoxin system VapC family toxin n=1 Tax=Parasphingomonas halimpatiens TaxID=3096162 RepID=UPI002FC9307D
MAIVIDASMAIAWLFEDERSDAARDVLRKIVDHGAMAPSLWRLEVANVLRNAVRRKRCDEDFVDRSLARLDLLPIAIDDETDRHAWGETQALARELGLTSYDAAYLELALRKGLPLATCDAELAAAARQRSVDVLTG